MGSSSLTARTAEHRRWAKDAMSTYRQRNERCIQDDEAGEQALQGIRRAGASGRCGVSSGVSAYYLQEKLVRSRVDGPREIPHHTSSLTTNLHSIHLRPSGVFAPLRAPHASGSRSSLIFNAAGTALCCFAGPCAINSRLLFAATRHSRIGPLQPPFHGTAATFTTIEVAANHKGSYRSLHH